MNSKFIALFFSPSLSLFVAAFLFAICYKLGMFAMYAEIQHLQVFHVYAFFASFFQIGRIYTPNVITQFYSHRALITTRVHIKAMKAE